MEPELDTNQVIDNLNAILEAELSGVVRYTHYSLMVTGPNRIPLVDFLESTSNRVACSCARSRRNSHRLWRPPLNKHRCY